MSKNVNYFKNCPVCGFNEFISVLNNKWKNSSYNKCLKCSLIFQNPQESIIKTKSRYNENYFKYELENQHNFFNLIKKTMDDFDILNILPEGASVLEIGSATGLFLKYMNENKFDAVGLEICRQSADYGKKNHKVNILNKTLEECKFKKNSFDFIHFSHLIEHLNDPINFLKIVNDITKPEGLIMITTPNSSGLFARIFKENWRCIVDDHLFIFNKKSLKILFKKTNFKISKIRSWGSIPKGKTLNIIKKISDHFVKLTNTGDVVCFLLKKC